MKRQQWRVGLILIALLWSGASQAQSAEICSPAMNCTVNQTVTPGQDTVVTVQWRGRVEGEWRRRLISETGFYSLGGDRGEPLYPLNRPLVETLPDTTMGGPFTVTETLQIPGELSRRVAQSGAVSFQFVRRFFVREQMVTGVQTIRLARPSPNAARSLREGAEDPGDGVLLSRLALRFDDGNNVSSIAPGELLRAQALLRYDRVGRINAVWEVATPATTRGNPVFRPLAPVRQYLGAGQESTLESPVLPSRERGLYLVRLRLIEPVIQQPVPVLRYQVGGEAQTPEQVARLPLVSPASGETLDSHTVFQWQRHPGAFAYQLAFYDRRPERQDVTEGEPVELAVQPVSGMMLGGDTQQTRASASVLNRLDGVTPYWWRVIAVDVDGQVVAASAVASLNAGVTSEAP